MNPAPKPKTIQVTESPKTNARVLLTDFFSPLLRIEMYTGIIGNIHGEKKEAIPAKYAVLYATSCVNLNLPRLGIISP